LQQLWSIEKKQFHAIFSSLRMRATAARIAFPTSFKSIFEYRTALLGYL
jgi:hypothetical protein